MLLEDENEAFFPLKIPIKIYSVNSTFSSMFRRMGKTIEALKYCMFITGLPMRFCCDLSLR